mmetsp:Transcript_5940/g.11123  ORF Transcript_5940/g.11123 Transcript_5940/m.11123 type:complete len:230 (+) Transcript_5940:982-1671(+)
MDLGSKAGSRVPLTMASKDEENSSQPTHSTKPTLLASSVIMKVPGGVSVTTLYAAIATSNSSPARPTARPSMGRGRYLFPSSPSMIPSPAAASLPLAAMEKNLSSAPRSFSDVTAGPFDSGSGGGPPAGGSVGGGSEALGEFTASHCLIMSRTLGARTTPATSASRTPAMTSAWLPASMPALIRSRGEGAAAGGGALGAVRKPPTPAGLPPPPGGCGGKAGAPLPQPPP